jgi:hypothetical protein
MTRINYKYVLLLTLTVIICLNLAVYFHDTQNIYDNTECGTVSCHNFALILAIAAAIIDILLIISLTYWLRIPTLTILLLAILIIIFILLQYYETHYRLLESKPTNQPKPTNQQNKFSTRIHISMTSTILLAQLFVLITRYFLETVPFSQEQTVFQNLVTSRFGGYIPGRKIKFCAAWGIIIGIMISIFRLKSDIQKNKNK